MNWAVAACVTAACLYGLGSVLQSHGAQRGGGPGIRGLATIVRQAPYVAGLGCDLLGWLLSMYAVNHLPLFAVYTTLAGSVAVTVVLAWLFLRSPLRAIDTAAIGAVLVGLVLVGFAAAPVPDTGVGTPARVVLVLGLPLAAVAGAVAVRGKRPIIAAVVAGLLFSLGAATVRTLELGRAPVELISQPAAWAVPIYLGAGLVVHARSLQHGNVGPVTASLWATEVLVAATAGYLLFGDHVRPGALWSAISGTILALGATIHLALSPSRTAAT